MGFKIQHQYGNVHLQGTACIEAITKWIKSTGYPEVHSVKFIGDDGSERIVSMPNEAKLRDIILELHDKIRKRDFYDVNDFIVFYEDKDQIIFVHEDKAYVSIRIN